MEYENIKKLNEAIKLINFHEERIEKLEKTLERLSKNGRFN